MMRGRTRGLQTRRGKALDVNISRVRTPLPLHRVPERHREGRIFGGLFPGRDLGVLLAGGMRALLLLDLLKRL